MRISSEKPAIRYSIYIGMNDKHFRIQRFETKRIVNLIAQACKHKRVSFSLYTQKGGYVYKDGKYVIENSVVLTLIGASEEDVNHIATDLGFFLNQETILIHKEQIMSYAIVNDHGEEKRGNTTKTKK